LPAIRMGSNPCIRYRHKLRRDSITRSVVARKM
jgi:hypothetical protein